jgi:hypothetical protein
MSDRPFYVDIDGNAYRPIENDAAAVGFWTTHRDGKIDLSASTLSQNHRTQLGWT